MHKFFSQDTRKQKRYVLYGLGGAGKTQIALKFIEDWTNFKDQFFVDASNKDTAETGLKNIAATKETGKSSQDALIWLASKHEDWLLFLDNADDPTFNLNQFFPKCNHGNIIITTRNHSARVHGAHSEVSNMEESDAVAVLLSSAQYESSPANELLAAEIVKVLCYFPLAIVQAGAFISESEALNTYLDLFIKNQTALLKRKPTQMYDNYAQAVYTTWEMSFSKLSIQAAMFLQLCSFLHQDDISEDIFVRATDNIIKSVNQTQISSYKEVNAEKFLLYFIGPTSKWNSLQFMEVINEIKRYSLINYNMERNSFSIHPLVHSWSQTVLDNLDAYHSCMDEILGMSIQSIPEQDRELLSLRLVSHVDSLMQTIPKLTSNFQIQYANIYRDAGQYTKAQELEVAEVERCKNCLGDDHPDTLQAMHNLAMTYDESGQFEEAEKLYVVVLERRQKLLGDDHVDTLHTMNSLAVTYEHLGQFEEAEKIYVVVLEKQKKLLGDDHLDTLHVMHNLAITYHKLGQFEEASKLYIVVLEKRKKLLGDDHLKTLQTMHNLAITYDNLGQFEEAEKLHVVVLEKQKKLLGDDHLDTLRTMHSLAITYDNLGQFEEAEKLYVVVLEKQKKLLGDDHLDTLRTMHSLAITYNNLGQFEEAEKTIYCGAREAEKDSW
ncbi:FabD/lysophospholipase-like protein [Mycena sanguinolenta]|uniref:FabD/lysophospholipase-like protein n=1 Tax=Mycena sanguinolenta TaxID=230812 RepID=A0A8H6X385_9AGAR|nr:FabD/lysophospholipase-like protein [Mycena sanguinolenta]